MAEVETVLQPVSGSGDSSESLALQCDLIYVDVLGQRFPQWGGGHLLSLPFLLQLLKKLKTNKKKKSCNFIAIFLHCITKSTTQNTFRFSKHTPGSGQGL